MAIVVIATVLVPTMQVQSAGAASVRAQQWSLDQLAVEIVHPDADGSGVVVAVLDTAIATGRSRRPLCRWLRFRGTAAIPRRRKYRCSQRQSRHDGRRHHRG